MEETNVGVKGRLHENVKQFIVDLKKIDGKALRRVSSTKSDGSIPSLSITAELKKLHCSKGDWVSVGISDGKIVIEILK